MGNLENVLSSVKQNKIFYVYVFIGNLLALTVGLMQRLPYYIVYYNQSNDSWDVTLLQFFDSLGRIIGPFLAVVVKHKFGLKKTFLAMAGTFIASLLIYAFAVSIAVFYCAKLFSGIAIGSVFVMLPIYIGELSRKHHRGAMISLMFVTTQLANLIAFPVYMNVDLMVYSLICAVAPCVFIAAFGYLSHHTPLELIAQGREGEAQAEINRLRGTTFTKDEYEETVKISNQDCTFISNKTLGAIAALAILQQFSGFGFTKLTFAIKAINSTTQTSMNVSNYIVYLVSIISAIIPVLIVDAIGRRTLLLTSAVGLLILHTFLAIYIEKHDDYDTPSALAHCLIPVFFNIGLGPVPWILMAESLPPKIRVMGSAVCGCCAFAASFILYIVLFWTKMTHNAMYWIFAFFNLLTLIFTVCAISETKGKNTIDIQKDFNSWPPSTY